jgi:hypothetical protein
MNAAGIVESEMVDAPTVGPTLGGADRSGIEVGPNEIMSSAGRGQIHIRTSVRSGSTDTTAAKATSVCGADIKVYRLRSHP